MAGRNLKCPRLKKGRLMEDHRRFHIFIITVPVVHIIISMVLTKGLSMIPHDDKDRPLQQSLLFEILIDTLQHIVQEVEVIIIATDRTLIRLDDAIIFPIVKIREMCGKTEIDADRKSVV